MSWIGYTARSDWSAIADWLRREWPLISWVGLEGREGRVARILQIDSQAATNGSPYSAFNSLASSWCENHRLHCCLKGHDTCWNDSAEVSTLDVNLYQWRNWGRWKRKYWKTQVGLRKRQVRICRDGKRKYGKCKYNANLQSQKNFGTSQVSVVHFQVGWASGLQIVFFLR